MPPVKDGPASSLFTPLALRGNAGFAKLAAAGVSKEMVRVADFAPTGQCVGWGIPFKIGRPVLIKGRPASVKFGPVRARWLVFMHTSDIRPQKAGRDGFISATRGHGQLGDHAADYVIVYADGTEERVRIRRRHQIGAVTRPWGENCFEAVGHHKPHSLKSLPGQSNPNQEWGRVQTRAASADGLPWQNWLWAWENPRPRKALVGVRFEPVGGAVVVSAVSAGNVSAHPLRWRRRRKAVLTLPRGETLDPNVDDEGLLAQIQLDMGQVISAASRALYPNASWARTYNNRPPDISKREAVIEYTSHPDARFHLSGGRAVPAARLEAKKKDGRLRVVAPAAQRVTVKAVEKGTRKPVPVKLHVHGQAGEYLAPVDRHRIINCDWFQDYSADYANEEIHTCTYIPGETDIDLPLGRVYVEVSKGFEIRPVRKVVRVTKATREIVIEIEKVLPWREKGWVSADTHVHFLSPATCLLEGAGEGVNVVNLLATQLGELMTNVGDFDGKTTHRDGEYLVRVGTENRQHVLGHISLLGYEGNIIAPMTTGGPDESAIGDPVEVLLTEWAAQCRKQGGLVILPHFPSPRGELAATVVSGNADGTEIRVEGALGNLYGGLSPYSLSDWYRYLNCGYMTAAVGGTDKMYASTAVGSVRTYACLRPGEEFTYEAWKEAVRRAHTFATFGPLLEFGVDGRPPGSRIAMSSTGGTVDVTWQVASVTVPMSRVELVVNGEIRESQAVRPDEDEGHWSIKVDASSWLALLVRGHYADKPEIIAAHSTPVMVDVSGSPFVAAADAVTILEQIEGALAFLDTIGTRAETAAYKRMRLVLTSAHRKLHNRMHQAGHYHDHTPADDHAEHH